MTRSLNYYDLLMVQRDATNEDIEAAYKRLIRAYHPDANVGGRQDLAGEMTRRLNEARDTLLDPEARGAYDTQLAMSSQGEGPGQADLTDDEVAAADEAWQNEVREHDAEAPGDGAPEPAAGHRRWLTRLWPPRATAGQRYFGMTRFIWNAVRAAGAVSFGRGALVAVAFLVFLLVAVVLDLATLPLIFFYLWPLPYDAKVLVPLGLFLSALLGRPQLPVPGLRASGMFLESERLLTFIGQHSWLAHINTTLLVPERAIPLLGGQTVSTLIVLVLGPLYRVTDQPLLAYGLTGLAILALPYRLWRFGEWLTTKLLAGNAQSRAQAFGE